MKITPWLLAGSIILNGVLGWKLLGGRVPAASEKPAAIAKPVPSLVAVAAAAQRPFVTPPAIMPPLGSAQVRAADFIALAERLRAQGFDTETVRKVVEDVIGHHFKQIGYATIRPKADATEYWKSPIYSAGAAETAARHKLEKEVNAMLEAVFGRNYDISEDRARGLFHGISAAHVEKMRTIFADYRELEAQAREQATSTADVRERLEILGKEKRADIERTLTPEELHAYDLRTGGAAHRLRSFFGSFEPTEAEFLALYPAFQVAEAAAVGATMSREARQAEEARLDQEARRVLGEERYAAMQKTKRR